MSAVTLQAAHIEHETTAKSVIQFQTLTQQARVSESYVRDITTSVIDGSQDSEIQVSKS